MPGRSVRIGRIAGIPVGVSPLWLVIVALLTWSLGASYYPAEVHGISTAAAYALGLASTLLLFASILAHEFGHALIARRLGVEVEEIDLWLLGGVARISGRAHRPEDELRFAVAGPAVTAMIAALFGAMMLALPASASDAVVAVVRYQLEVNLLILGFNLVPAFPLDGGRIARALLWRRRGDIVSATNAAAALGRWFGYLLVGSGLLLTLYGAVGGLWFMVIGWFLIVAATAERQQEQVLAALGGVRAVDLMSHPAVTISTAATLSDAEDYFAGYRYTAFPVVDLAGRAVGMLSIGGLERTAAADRPSLRTGECSDHDPSLLISVREEVAHVLELPAFTRVGRAAVVDAQGRPVGVLSITDIERAIRATSLRGPRGSSTTPVAH